MDLRVVRGWGEAAPRAALALLTDVVDRGRAGARRATDELLDALWPRVCWLCRAPVEAPIESDVDGGTRSSGASAGPLACAAHRLSARGLTGNRCERCARHLPHGVRAGERCRACRARAPRFARVLAAGEYTEPLSAWVLALKHGGRSDLARPLGRHLAAACAAVSGAPARTRAQPHDQGPLLCAVPLHPLRRIERGYDQASLLARALGEALERPVITPLVRLRATSPQGAEGGRATRRSNVAGAFGLARGALGGRPVERLLAGRDVWLVDDVFTSGATADTCAEVLRRGGARSVTVVVLARAGAHERDAGRDATSEAVGDVAPAPRPGRGRAPPRGA